MQNESSSFQPNPLSCNRLNVKLVCKIFLADQNLRHGESKYGEIAIQSTKSQKSSYPIIKSFSRR